MKNPYIHRKMICSSENFFGRRQELSRIYSLIEGMQEVSIVGGRRIGKSSLLCCLALPEIQGWYGQYDLSKHIFVYIDLLRCARYTPEEFLKYLLEELYRVTHERGRVAGRRRKFTPRSFSTAIDRVNDAGKKVVFLLDEFDYVASNQHFDLDFFNFLRSIAHKKELSFITASTKSLLDLCHTSVISSPFFNIFSVLELREFKQDEALQLIRGPSAQAGCSLERDEQFILELAGTHPFLLQVVCFLVFEARMRNCDGPLDRSTIRTAFERQVHDHFEHAWRALEDEERLEIREAAANGTSVHPMLSSLSFREFVLQNKSSRMAEIKQLGRRMTIIGTLFMNRRSLLVMVGGVVVTITLLFATLYLDLVSGLQELLLIGLTATGAWLVRELARRYRNARKPQEHDEGR